MPRAALWVARLSLSLTVATTQVFVSAADAPPATKPVDPAKAAADKAKADANRYMAFVKQADLPAGVRQEAVGRLLAGGAEGLRQLAPYAAREAELRRDVYTAAFEKAAAEVVRTRLKSAGGSQKVEAEVAELRKKSLDVSRMKDLTKAAISETCDPAIKRLRELMAVSPQEVLEQQSDVAALRADALGWAKTAQTAGDKLTATGGWEPVAITSSAKADPAPKPGGKLVIPVSVELFEQELSHRERLLSLLATPMNKADRAVLVANVPLAAKLDPEEASAIAELNELRVLLGIGVQAIDPKLCDAARGHSKDMVEKNFFDHMSPIPGKETPSKRAALAGTSGGAENIYAGSRKGTDAIKAWWYSPGHHANMMGTGRRIGVGRENGHFTQMFGG